MWTKLIVGFVGISLTWLLAWRLRSAKARQVLFLIVSYVFYASIGGRLLAVLMGSSLLNYAWGRYLRRRPSAGRLWGGIAANLVLLATFKYLPALAASLQQPSGWMEELAQVALPIGMSFWTFQALSYLFDLYREEELDPSLLEFCLYMAFGPTVLSGPICRLPEMLPQFRERFSPTASDLHRGLQRMWLGVFMMSLAQMLGAGIMPGEGIDAGFQAVARLRAADVWLLAIGYGFQLFFDFAGYSHIVIGLAQTFGFRLAENFNSPYLSTTPSVFWTRWHMSLSFWIRDNVFLPLAVMRREVWWRNLCLVIAMVTFGLWHKAKLMFVVWGAYHGLLLVLHRLWQGLQRRIGFNWPRFLGAVLPWAVTFFAVCLGWILFRADTLEHALTMLGRAFSPAGPGFGLPSHFYLLVCVVVAGYFTVAGLRALVKRDDGLVFSWIPLELRFACYAVMLYLVVFRGAQPQGFIYFQF